MSLQKTIRQKLLLCNFVSWNFLQKIFVLFGVYVLLQDNMELHLKSFKTFGLTLVLIFSAYLATGQADHILKVLFRYGSRPAHGYEKEEKYDFGGIHGGHVCLGIDSVVVGFDSPKGFHIFPRKKNLKGVYVRENEDDYMQDTIKKKYAIIEIPISDEQYLKLNTILTGYLNNTPYDYAFFGMRCASATYDVLSQIGILKTKSYSANVFSNFYPKLLRRKLFHLAKENNYKVIKLKGRKTRQWEKD